MAKLHVNPADIVRTKQLPSGYIRTWHRVVSRITRTANCIEYEVVLDGDDNDQRGHHDGEGGYELLVWDDEVRFGHEERFRAGGAAFQEASREQDRIAVLCAARLRKTT